MHTPDLNIVNDPVDDSIELPLDSRDQRSMNTSEARQRLLELTGQATEIVRRLSRGGSITSQDRVDMREVLREARDLVYDAGYPGDAAWRALLRANVYVTTPPSEVDAEFWSDLLADLEEGAEQLSTVTADR